MGVRVGRAWKNEQETRFIPYGRINYYHGFGSAPKVNISALDSTSGGYDFKGGRYGDSLQFGLGLTIEAKENLSFYSEVDYQKNLSSAGMKGWRGNIGLRWDF